jgi:hypothetical protein
MCRRSYYLMQFLATDIYVKVCKYISLQHLDLLQRILKMAAGAIRTTTDKLQLSVPITPR